MNFTQIIPLPLDEPRPLVRPGAKGAFKKVGTMPAPLASIVRIQDPKRATVISEDHNQIDVCEWVAGSVARTASLALPEDMHALDAILKGDFIFVCGGYRWPTESADILLTRRIEGGEWSALPIPEHFQRPGKTINALLLDGGRLIAVDNSVKPKCFLEYHVEKPERPMLLGTPELRHQPGEHAKAAALGTRFVAVLSAATANETLDRYVRLYERQTLVESAYATMGHKAMPGTYREAPSPLGGDERVSNRQWHDLAFVGDTLLIAGGADGVGRLDTSRLKALERAGSSQRAPAPAYLGEEDLRFDPPRDGGEVTAMVPVPALNGAYAIEKSAKGRSARWVSSA